MARWAVICEKTKRVHNCIEWDGIAQWSPNPGFYVIQTDEGDRYDLHDPENKKFIKHHKLSDYPEFKPE